MLYSHLFRGQQVKVSFRSSWGAFDNAGGTGHLSPSRGSAVILTLPDVVGHTRDSESVLNVQSFGTEFLLMGSLHVIASGWLDIFTSLFWGSCFFPCTGQKNNTGALEFFPICVVFSCVAQSVGCVVGSCLHSSEWTWTFRCVVCFFLSWPLHTFQLKGFHAGWWPTKPRTNGLWVSLIQHRCSEK